MSGVILTLILLGSFLDMLSKRLQQLQEENDKVSKNNNDVKKEGKQKLAMHKSACFAYVVQWNNDRLKNVNLNPKVYLWFVN